MKRLVIFIAAVLASVSAQGQSADTAILRRWTLGECIEYALEHNISIRASALDTLDARLTLREARFGFTPSITATVDYETDFGRTLTPTNGHIAKTSTTIEPSIDASITLFAGFKQWYSLRKSELGLRQSLANFERTQDDIALAVAALYFEILNARAQLAIADQSVTLLHSRVDALMSAAEVNISDLLQIKAHLSEVLGAQISAQRECQLALFKLARLIDLDIREPFDIADADDAAPVPITASLDDILIAAADLPRIKSSELGIEIAARNVQIARAGLYPTLTITGGYGSSYSSANTHPITAERYPFASQMRDGAAAYIGLTLSVPIFNQFEARNNLSHNRIAYQRAQLSHETIQKELAAEIGEAYIETQSALHRYEASRLSVESYAEAFRDIEQRFALGKAAAVDYNLALIELTQAQSEFERTKYSYMFKWLLLSYYLNSVMSYEL